MIGTALIGHGYWGSILERYIRADGRFNLKYVCDSKSNLAEVWSDRGVDAVVITVRNEQRYDLVKTALLCGKRVLTEKPLALNYKQAQELGRMADNDLVVDYTFTVSEGLRMAGKLVREKVFGELLGFDMVVNHLAPFGGGDVYWILGSHLLSIVDMFVPLSTLTFKRKDLVVDKDVVETGVILAKGQVNGQMRLSLNYPEKVMEVVLYGEKGTIVYNPRKQEPLALVKYEKPVWVREVPSIREIFKYDEANNLKGILDYFYDVLMGKRESNVKVAVEITKILEEIQECSSC